MEFAAVIAIVFALSLTVTKVVDFIRNVADKDDSFPKWVWNLVAFAVGVLFCVLWQKNFAQDLLAIIPALADDQDKVAGFWGYLISGVILGSLAGFGHELLDNLSSGAEAKQAAAVGTPPIATNEV